MKEEYGHTCDIAMKQKQPGKRRLFAGCRDREPAEDLCKPNVLNGISLSVNRGEPWPLLGRSGTGKSVLLRLIIGIETPDSGSVRIHDQESSAWLSIEWRNQKEDGLLVSARGRSMIRSRSPGNVLLR